MKRAKLIYYCDGCDTTLEKFIEFNSDQLPMLSIKQTLLCCKTRRCKEMKLIKLGLPDSIKNGGQSRLLG